MRTVAASLVLLSLLAPGPARAQTDFNDVHFHLTNYIQEGLEVEDYLELMGSRVGRSTLFGIPLQQTWAYHNSGDFAPTYYLETDAPLYYYSFTDAYIASIYRALPLAQQNRFDPMITGFNPADVYAVAHIRRVLRTFPGVFSGIGEFTVHKEFVSSKVAGETASLTDPALDSILRFAGETGLVVLLHNDLDMPFGKPGREAVYYAQMRELLARHPETTIVWAHVGLGRIVRPVLGGTTDAAERAPDHVELVESLLGDPRFSNLHFDISWDEVAKYLTATPESVARAAALIERHPDRFLFGTDNVASPSAEKHFAIYEQYAPLWRALSPATSEMVRKGNYERLFDAARHRVRTWERTHLANGG